MKTVTAVFYHPWGSSAYCIDLWYYEKKLRTFEGHDLDELRALAKAWAIIKGFTHMKQDKARWKL
jgi:hypothetical protein